MPGTVGHVDPLTAVLAILAVARLTRLITTDRILDTPRHALIQRMGPEHPVSYAAVCDWCVSIYVGAGVAAAVWAWQGAAWLTGVLLALSASYATGWLASRTED